MVLITFIKVNTCNITSGTLTTSSEGFGSFNYTHSQPPPLLSQEFFNILNTIHTLYAMTPHW